MSYKRPQQARTRARVAAKSASADPGRDLDAQLDDAVDRDEPVCFLRQFADTPCHGRLVKAHLLPRRLLLRELPAEASAAAIDDPRSWAPACGGIDGTGGHHGLLDRPAVNELRVPYEALPAGVVALAVELGLSWYLERTYPREEAA